MKGGAFQNASILKTSKDKLICLKNESNNKDPGNVLGGVLYSQINFGSGGVPMLFFIGPDGKELEKYRHLSGKPLSADELGDMIQKVLKESGSPLTPSDYKKFKEAIEKSDEFVKQGSYKTALGKLDSIARHSAKKAGIVQRAREKVEAIHKIGEGLLDEAKQLESDKKWLEAYQQYQRIEKEFGTAKVVKDARDAMARLMKDPEAGKAIKGDKK